MQVTNLLPISSRLQYGLRSSGSRHPAAPTAGAPQEKRQLSSPRDTSVNRSAVAAIVLTLGDLDHAACARGECAVSFGERVDPRLSVTARSSFPGRPKLRLGIAENLRDGLPIDPGKMSKMLAAASL